MKLSEVLLSKQQVSWVVTTEKSRTMKSIRQVWNELGPVHHWSLTSGLNRSFDDSQDEDWLIDKIRQDPVGIVPLGDKKESVLYVLENFDFCLNNAKVLEGIESFFLPGNVNDAGRNVGGLVKRNVYVVIVSACRPKDGVAVRLRRVPVVEVDLPDRKMMLAMAGKARQTNIGDDPEILADAMLGLTDYEARNALALSKIRHNEMSVEGVMAMKAEILADSIEGVEIITNPVDPKDIGGLESVKEHMLEVSMCQSQEARDFGIPAEDGVLFVGVSGCGKSFCAKSLGHKNAMNRSVLRLDMSACKGSLVGQSEQNLIAALRTAEAIKPSILWLDEIEKSVSQDMVGGGGDSGTTSGLIGILLNWMQERNSKPDVEVFVVATANTPELLPPEMLRRFGTIFAFDLPDESERVSIFKVHVTKQRTKNAPKRYVSEFDISLLASMTAGFISAEIEKAVIGGLRRAFVAKECFATEHVLSEIKSMVPVSVSQSEGIERMRSWSKGRARLASGNGKKPNTVSLDDVKNAYDDLSEFELD